MHLHHIAVQVSDLERARTFYHDLLGLREIRRQPHSLWFALGDAILMLERCESPALPSPWKSEHPGLFLLALQIEDTERLKWRSRLLKANVPIEKESQYTLYFRDPDGNRIGLSHYPIEASES